jgi:hypothetical protein
MIASLRYPLPQDCARIISVFAKGVSMKNYLNQFKSTLQGFAGKKPDVDTSHSFNIFSDASTLIDQIWGSDIPAFDPQTLDPSEPVFKDSEKISHTLQALAELTYYNKNRSNKSKLDKGDAWILQKFSNHSPDEYLPGLQLILNRHFSELIQDGPWQLHEKVEEPPADLSIKTILSWKGMGKSAEENVKNNFYIPGYQSVPDLANLDDFLAVVGIEKARQPINCDYLIKAYNRLSVKLERFISISHLLMAGAQSEAEVSDTTLEREYMLQEKIRELRSSYIVEYSTVRLAFTKRHFGVQMFDKLNEFTSFKKRHEVALSVASERLSVGADQYPSILKSTQKFQRIFKGLGQLLLGGFLASEIINTVREWASVYYHRNNYAFFSELFKIQASGATPEYDQLLDRFYDFEILAVYASIMTVFVVIFITLYFKAQNKSLHNDPAEGGGHHH